MPRAEDTNSYVVVSTEQHLSSLPALSAHPKQTYRQTRTRPATMVKPVASLSTLLLLSCGINFKSSITVTAVAYAANTAIAGGTGGAGASTSCVEDPDQPKCSRSQNTCESTGEDGECSSLPLKNDQSGGTTDSEAATENNDVGSVGYQKFHVGDVIELFNTESQDIQIVFPSLVAGKDPMGGYHVTKTTDGKEVKNIPERFLHHYIPYKVGSEVLCNIGDFKPARPMIVKCTVLAYESTASKGAKVLQNEYSVKVHQTKANEEFETTLPVWKLQRRYRAA